VVQQGTETIKPVQTRSNRFRLIKVEGFISGTLVMLVIGVGHKITWTWEQCALDLTFVRLKDVF